MYVTFFRSVLDARTGGIIEDMGRVTVGRPVRMISAHGQHNRPDTLAVEEPLEIRVNGSALAVTMRTPGSDIELAHGFLLSEGVLGSAQDVDTVRFCAGADEQGRNTYNVLDVTLAPGVEPPGTGASRNFYTTSSCGVCGKASLDAVRTITRFPVNGPDPHGPLSPELLTTLPDTLRARQKVFRATGGLHAAGLFTSSGAALVVREDIGRHNAVDKVFGWALINGKLPGRDCVLVLSGRVSFELVQKAAMAGVPVIAAVSAPSSLAVELADEQGITVIGFLRGPSMNVYTHGHRVA